MGTSLLSIYENSLQLPAAIYFSLSHSHHICIMLHSVNKTILKIEKMWVVTGAELIYKEISTVGFLESCLERGAVSYDSGLLSEVPV